MDRITARKSLSLDSCQTLVGRSDELESIIDFLRCHIEQEKPGVMYLSGLPGTGKTACVKSALKTIQIENEVDVVFINCMEVSSTSQLHKTILERLSAKSSLNPRKTTPAKKPSDAVISTIASMLTSNQNMIILCLDEIDQLSTLSMDALYTIFSWPKVENSRLILVGVANAFDLTDRLMPKLKPSADLLQKRINFAPYSKSQIEEILKFRLKDVSDVLSEPAIKLCARKVSAITGDIRKALDICKLALDTLEESSARPDALVQPNEIVDTINAVYGERSNLSSSLTLQQKLALAVILKLTERTQKSFSTREIFSVYKKSCEMIKMPAVGESELQQVLQLLASMQLIRRASRSRKVDVDEYYKLDVDCLAAKRRLNDDNLLSLVLHCYC